MASDKLSTYKQKRDFQKTQEPSGQAALKASNRRRFVIQKHDATRLHYDLRLELDGVFKSWAVTRGPSLDPHDKRLAVEVEDHPLDYGDFEGTIPKGQYGGGTVMLWDRGYWEPEGNKSPEEALAKRDFKFTLEGERLHGSFVLVRMRNDRDGGKRTNWLLIKHHDDFSVEENGAAVLEENATSVASGRTMDAIAAGKGKKPKPFMIESGAVQADAVWDSNHGLAAEERKAGTKAKTKPAPARSAMPEFIPPQLCETRERPPSADGWIHEIKFDGYRIQMRIESGEVTLKTRKGLDWTGKYPAIAASAATLPDAIIDGEICALDEHGAPDFAALQAALSEGKTDALVYFAFDLLFECITTPTEASVIAVIYAMLVGLFLHREMTWQDLVDAFRKSVVTSAVIMFIIGTASLMGYLLNRQGVPDAAALWLTSTFDGPLSLMLAINAMLFVIGMFIETGASIIVLAPILQDAAARVGIAPVHFGTVMVVNLALGMITPPLGVNLFAAAQIAGCSVTQMLKPLMVFVTVIVLCLLMITFVPALSMTLPALIGR